MHKHYTVAQTPKHGVRNWVPEDEQAEKNMTVKGKAAKDRNPYQIRMTTKAPLEDDWDETYLREVRNKGFFKWDS